ncbi:MAG TPA: riboflavin synthase [Actinomycetota bacterium]|nr:riboflavin synthase [Actinomycetota bacterium]
MFTGIVEHLGVVRSLARDGEGARLEVEAGPVGERATLGASVAVDGVCLTVVEREGGRLRFDLAEETLGRTTLGELTPGARVNLEGPLTLSSPLGGHLVQGHVDGVGSVVAVEGGPSGTRMRVAATEAMARYLVEKGSVAVDGVSLTVAATDGAGTFEVALVPHTLEVTTLGARRTGDRVNLEVDIVAKYVERLVREDR